MTARQGVVADEGQALGLSCSAAKAEHFLADPGRNPRKQPVGDDVIEFPPVLVDFREVALLETDVAQPQIAGSCARPGRRAGRPGLSPRIRCPAGLRPSAPGCCRCRNRAPAPGNGRRARGPVRTTRRSPPAGRGAFGGGCSWDTPPRRRRRAAGGLGSCGLAAGGPAVGPGWSKKPEFGVAPPADLGYI